MTDKQDLIREIHEYVTTHGGENTATHLLVQAASAIQTQAAELEAIGAGGVSGPLMGRTAPPTAQAEGWTAEQALRNVLAAVQRHMPPDGPDAKDTLSEIIAIVDPWPLGPLEKS